MRFTYRSRRRSGSYGYLTHRLLRAGPFRLTLYMGARGWGLLLVFRSGPVSWIRSLGNMPFDATGKPRRRRPITPDAGLDLLEARP